MTSDISNQPGNDHGKEPAFIFDNEPVRWDEPTISGAQLRKKFSVPANVQIFQKIPGHKDREILDDTVVDLRGKGPERFSTQAVGSGAGLQTAVARLLTDEDYEKLIALGIEVEEELGVRHLVFKQYPLPLGVYMQEKADILVQIPSNYPHDGIDMLWLSPRLQRTTGKEVPEQMQYGSGNNLHFRGVEFCRWSRHWNNDHNRWRPGLDAIETILRRLDWALAHPDADRA